MNPMLGSRFGSATAVLVIGLALAVTVAGLTPVPAAARAAAVLAFGLIGPGATVCGALGIRDLATWLAVTLGGSITAGVLVSEAAAITSWWEPESLMLALAALCSAGTVLMWWLDRPATTSVGR